MVCNCADETLCSRLRSSSTQHRHFLKFVTLSWGRCHLGVSASWWLPPLGSLWGLLTIAACHTAPRYFFFYSHEFCDTGHSFAFDISHVSCHFLTSFRVVTPYLVCELIGVLQGLQFVYFNVFEYKGQSSDLTCLLARHNSCFDWILLVTDVL